jgi:hypothetical protein
LGLEVGLGLVFRVYMCGVVALSPH